MTQQQTRITHLAWGEMKVQVGEETFTFRDCKIWPGGAVEWDWNLTGTHHIPGIQPSDIEEILQQGVEAIVLSRGQQLRLQISPETKAVLQERGVEMHILETRRAVELFNALMDQGMVVGGIFHSTC